jgi:hypothetical protein
MTPPAIDVASVASANVGITPTDLVVAITTVQVAATSHECAVGAAITVGAPTLRPTCPSTLLSRAPLSA